jgi:gliding motility-associated-like protein
MHSYPIHLCLLTLAVLVISKTTGFGQYNLRGTAKAIAGTDCFQLTERKIYEYGAVWYDQKLDLRTSFSLEFTLNFDNNAGGADGIMFVMQTVGPNALGANGQGLGFAGFSPSLGVEFDTYTNKDYGDPTYDHMGVLRDGNTNHFLSSSLTTPTRIKANKDMVKDGLDYRVRIVWDAPLRRLKVLVDCEERISVTVDLINDVFKGSNQVWWGFTASTGYQASRQTVCLNKNIVEKASYSVCQGETVQLLARPSIDNQYTWSPAAELNNPESRNPTVRPARSQWYTVLTHGYCNASIRDSFYVEVKSSLSLELGPDKTVCPDIQEVTFTPNVTPASPGLIYKWSTGATSSTLKVSQPGRYSLEVMNGACIVHDTVQLSYFPVPAVRFPADKRYCLGDGPVTLSVQTQESNLAFSWMPGDGTQPTHTIMSPGTYQVLVTNSEGCKVVDNFVVNEFCEPKIFVPTAFSPNGDNVNDELKILSQGVGEFELLIYNRWGSVIFHTTDPLRRWDGVFNNIPCDAGVYAYQLKYKSALEPTGPPLSMTGQVILIR